MNEMWRWVDPRVEQVRLVDLRAYLVSRGWKEKPYTRPQVVVFEKSVAEGEEPVVQLLPDSEQARDFRRSVIEAITSLSAIEERHPIEILNQILDRAGHVRPDSPNGPKHGGAGVESAGPEQPSVP
jgi:hypothetical protein